MEDFPRGWANWSRLFFNTGDRNRTETSFRQPAQTGFIHDRPQWLEQWLALLCVFLVSFILRQWWPYNCKLTFHRFRNLSRKSLLRQLQQKTWACISLCWIWSRVLSELISMVREMYYLDWPALIMVHQRPKGRDQSH